MSWQGLWCAAGVYRGAALTTGLHQEHQRQGFSARELPFFYRYTWAFFFAVAMQLGEILFLIESSVSLENIKSMTDLLSVGFPKDPGIPWSLLEFTVGSRI